MEQTRKTSEEIICPISKGQLLEHCQGQRDLTSSVIEAFPEDKLFEFNVGGMRSFGVMCMELLAVSAPSAKGFTTGEREASDEHSLVVQDKKHLLEAWDFNTLGFNKWFPQISDPHFQEVIKAFNTYEGEVCSSLL